MVEILRNQRVHGKEYQTLKKIAGKLNISPVYVSDIERGCRPFPVKRFNEFMKAYGFSESEKKKIAKYLIDKTGLSDFLK